MLTIYGLYRSRASRNIWLCHELDIPFKLVPVIQTYRLKGGKPPAGMIETKSAEFMKVNPNGHIPSIDDDGLVLHESLAINLYLAKKHGGPLAPANVAEDGQMSMWSLWAAAEIENLTLSIAQNGEKPETLEALKIPFASLNQSLAKTGWLVGGRFTVADANVAEVVRYAATAKSLFDANPNVKKWYDACVSRPAYKKMWAEREAEPA